MPLGHRVSPPTTPAISIDFDAQRWANGTMEDDMQAPDQTTWTKPRLLQLSGASDSAAGKVNGPTEGNNTVFVGTQKYSPSAPI